MARDAPARLFRVDLSSATVRSERVPESWLDRYVGGKGLGARYLYEEVPAGTDPLSPANALLFMVGPVTGRTPGEARYAAVTKSPLTGAFLDSYGGGSFPARLAGALDDHVGVLVTGAADEPVVLEVEGGDARLRPAPGLWGADTVETDEAFPEAAVACVGPAGEAGVQYATVASDAGDHHAGRGGAGTVMGSKRLKAVVARGDPPSAPAALAARYASAFADSGTGEWLSAGGTLETVDFADEFGLLPTRGWQEGRFEGASDIGVEAAREHATGRERPDDAVPGGFRVEGNDGEAVPRGATLITLGAGLGIDEFDAVAALGALCDRLGIDVITAGNAVAWAVRASEAGHLDRDLSFGDPEAARALVREVVARETPLGDALARGVDAAAERFGGPDLIPTVKGMDLSSYDPRGAVAMALAYATSDRGACHRRARPVEAPDVGAVDGDRVAAVVAEQDRRAVLWSLVADDFLEEVLRADLGAEWLAAAGREYDREALAAVGERVWTLVRLFNVREGFDRADDELPPALLEPLEGGPRDGASIDQGTFDALLDRYYRHRGWDAEGRPTRATVERLDLTGAVDDDTPLGETAAGAEASGDD